PPLSTPSRQYTTGPRIKATRPTLALTWGGAWTRSTGIGRVSRTTSPACQGRVICPYPPPALIPSHPLPLTVVTGPGRPHRGTRGWGSNVSALSGSTVIWIVSAQGYLVSWVSLTLPLGRPMVVVLPM